MTKLKQWVVEGSQPVVVGESFGGLLALEIATRLSEEDPATFERLRGFTLINPASSYGRTAWSTARLGDFVSRQTGNAYAASFFAVSSAASTVSAASNG
jgi:pimeloyl-ACP methyl ester carboxylesterase